MIRDNHTIVLIVPAMRKDEGNIDPDGGCTLDGEIRIVAYWTVAAYPTETDAIRALVL